ncbi:MAG: hypothetical protein M1497_00590 [Nitrospirae bacterium]|nr:hypothetical protein [Nitrospirota bacterium]
MRSKLFCFSVSCVLVLLSAAGAEEKPEPQNLIRQEMAALDKAFKTTLDAVVLNEPERIAGAYEDVNRIRERLKRAEKEGTPIVLPRNQKRFREFARLDDKFHKDVRALVRAAAKKKVPAVRRETHRLLDACVRCHAIFRK